MEFSRVRGFLAVAKTGSFSEAAKSLFLTQSAISVQVKKLEAELNVRLFDRVGRKIRLTAAGEQFQVYAEQIVRTVESATLGLAGAPHLQRGTLRLSAPPSVCSYFLPPVLKKFNDRYPHVKIALDPTISSIVVENVIWGTSDLGLASLPCSDRRLVVEELLADPLLLAVHPAHALANRRIVGLAEVAPYPFISIVARTPRRTSNGPLARRADGAGSCQRPSLS